LPDRKSLLPPNHRGPVVPLNVPSPASPSFEIAFPPRFRGCLGNSTNFEFAPTLAHFFAEPLRIFPPPPPGFPGSFSCGSGGRGPSAILLRSPPVPVSSNHNLRPHLYQGFFNQFLSFVCCRVVFWAFPLFDEIFFVPFFALCRIAFIFSVGSSCFASSYPIHFSPLPGYLSSSTEYFLSRPSDLKNFDRPCLETLVCFLVSNLCDFSRPAFSPTGSTRTTTDGPYPDF